MRSIDHTCLSPAERAERYRALRHDGVVQIRGPKWRGLAGRDAEARELKRAAKILGDDWAREG